MFWPPFMPPPSLFSAKSVVAINASLNRSLTTSLRRQLRLFLWPKSMTPVITRVRPLVCNKKNLPVTNTGGQVRNIERAANLHEHLFANTCLRIIPKDATMKQRCDKYIDKIFGNDPIYKNMARTRENALVMFQKAHQAALEELSTKQKRIETAFKQVEKGEKRVQTYNILGWTTTGLRMVAQKLRNGFAVKRNACCPNPSCGACASLIALCG